MGKGGGGVHTKLAEQNTARESTAEQAAWRQKWGYKEKVPAANVL